MADDRPDLHPASEPTDDGDFAWAPESERELLRRALPPITPEWEAENIDWIRAKVQEALDDPRPALSDEEVGRLLDEHMKLLEAKHGR